jgi:uncharacterized membrane protein YoaK (UPF0700 family)
MIAPVRGNAQPETPDARDPFFPAYLGFTAGAVDVTGWLTLGGLFTAHITGNLVVMAANLMDGRAIHLAQVVSVPAFALIAAAIGLAARPWIRSELEPTLLGLQLILLALAGVVACVTRASLTPFGVHGLVVAMLAVAAMASQNALLHLSRQGAPATAVMTGNLVVSTLSLVSFLTSHGAERQKALAQGRSTWPVLAGFLTGCAAGAGAVRLWADAAWFVAVLATALIWILRPLVRRLQTT